MHKTEAAAFINIYGSALRTLALFSSCLSIYKVRLLTVKSGLSAKSRAEQPQPLVQTSKVTADKLVC